MAAWERSLQLDPAADGVKKKLDDTTTRLQRLKGERPKTAQ